MKLVVSVVRIDSPQGVTQQKKITPWSSSQPFFVFLHGQFFLKVSVIIITRRFEYQPETINLYFCEMTVWN